MVGGGRLGGVARGAGADATAAYGSVTGMGAAGILGLAVVFVPSFFVSPGLVQKTCGARSPAGARWASLGNAAALSLFAFVPALFGMAIELGLEFEIGKVTDVKDIMKFGVFSTPALVVDGKVKSVGKILDAKQIKDILRDK